MKRFLFVALAVLLAASLTASAQTASSSQVVFSGAGTGTFGGKSSPFGFWVWCESNSTNPYFRLCNGAMYVYALSLTRSVRGRLSEFNPTTKTFVAPGAGGVESDIFQMTVSSADGKIACTLTNTPPITSGPTNNVTASCSAPVGGGSSKTSVVAETGGS